jgi:capsule polysaccharide export protein KpsC/LpsZ
VFAAAYILYPRYMCPFTFREIGFEAALKILQAMKAVAAAA